MNAIEKYLEQYAQPALRELETRYRCAVVIPYYHEDPCCLKNLCHLAIDVLLIAVVNNTASSPPEVIKANQNIIEKLRARPSTIVIDRSSVGFELPDPGGVGLARKIGCDTALALYDRGFITSAWIHTSDADACLPEGYTRLNKDIPKGAVVYPFRHMMTGDAQHDHAMQRYEEALLSYARGLKQAKSPYAYVAIGSCLAVHAESYAAVRGFSSKRQAGEDFYILNNIRRIAEVSTLEDPVIKLSARLSERVPFGTGQAVAKLIQDGPDSIATGFAQIYPDEAFLALGQYLKLHELNTDAPRSQWQNFDALKTLRWLKKWSEKA